MASNLDSVAGIDVPERQLTDAVRCRTTDPTEILASNPRADNKSYRGALREMVDSLRAEWISHEAMEATGSHWSSCSCLAEPGELESWLVRRAPRQEPAGPSRHDRGGVASPVV